MYLSVLLLCVISFVVNHVAAKEKVVICYYGTWATYRYGLGKFDVTNINVDLCTHLVYTFVGINEQGSVISLDAYLDLPDNWGRDNFGKFTALKQQNPNLKTILAVGGWNEASAKYSTMAASSTLRANFISTASSMVRQYGFDGLDIDWEYPSRRDSVYGQADMNNFSQLLKELREEFDKYGLFISIAVSPVKDTASLSYDIPTIVLYVDIVNVMTYDMYGGWDAVTGHNSPLHKGEGDENVAKEDVYSVDVALDYWLGQGCPPEKLALGLPLYGHTFQLTNANNNGVRAPSNGVGIAGPYTATNGVIGYNEFCQKLRDEIWEVRYDSLAKVPYAIQGQNWVSYDDADSLVAKIEYASQYDIAGVMVWSIETDDFHGNCNSEDFPLLRAINRAIGRSNSTTTAATPTFPTSAATTSTLPPTTATPTSASTGATTTGGSAISNATSQPTTVISTIVTPTTTPPPTTQNPTQTTATTTSAHIITTKGPIDTTTYSKISSTTTTSTSVATVTTQDPTFCKEEGFHINPNDCSSFYVCVRGLYGDFEPKLLHCPNNLYWDHAHSICNYAYLVECNVN